MTGFLLRGMWASLWCLVRRRQNGVTPGVHAFRAPPPSTSSMTVLLGAAAGGVVASGLLVPWSWLQVMLVAVCLWALLLVVSLMVCGQTHPHLLDADALVLRHLTDEVARLPRAAVSAELVDVRDGAAPGVGNGRLHLPGPDGHAGVHLVLAEPTTARLRGRDVGSVREVTLDVTTPKTLVGELTPPAT